MESLLGTVLRDEKKAIDLVCRIYILEYQAGYDKNTKTIIDKAKVKPNINEIQKEIEDIRKVYQQLDYSIRYSPGLERVMSELNVFGCKIAEAAWS